MQKDFPSAKCSVRLCAMRRLVDDYELGDVSVSLFTVQLRCACVHLRFLFLDSEAVFFKLFSVRRL